MRSQFYFGQESGGFRAKKLTRDGKDSFLRSLFPKFAPGCRDGGNFVGSNHKIYRESRIQGEEGKALQSAVRPIRRRSF